MSASTQLTLYTGYTCTFLPGTFIRDFQLDIATTYAYMCPAQNTKSLYEFDWGTYEIKTKFASNSDKITEDIYLEFENKISTLTACCASSTLKSNFYPKKKVLSPNEEINHMIIEIFLKHYEETYNTEWARFPYVGCNHGHKNVQRSSYSYKTEEQPLSNDRLIHKQRSTSNPLLFIKA